MLCNKLHENKLVSITGIFELISLGCCSRSHTRTNKKQNIWSQAWPMKLDIAFDATLLPWLPQKCSHSRWLLWLWGMDSWTQFIFWATPNVMSVMSQVNKHATFSFHTAWTDMLLKNTPWIIIQCIHVSPCSPAPLGVQCHFKFAILLPLTYFCLGFPLPAVSPQRRSDPVTPCNTWPLVLWELDNGWQFKLILENMSRSMLVRGMVNFNFIFSVEKRGKA